MTARAGSREALAGLYDQIDAACDTWDATRDRMTEALSAHDRDLAKLRAQGGCPDPTIRVRDAGPVFEECAS